jgi:hypothetical protein
MKYHKFIGKVHIRGQRYVYVKDALKNEIRIYKAQTKQIWFRMGYYNMTPSLIKAEVEKALLVADTP